MNADDPDPKVYEAEVVPEYRPAALYRPVPVPRDIGDDPAMRLLLPVGRSLWAIAAGYLGLLSLLFVFGPFALFCGIMAVIDIRNHPEKHGLGRAWFGIVLGALGTIGLVIGLIAMLLNER